MRSSELQFDSYQSPPWVEDGGNPWKKGEFNPNAFDPAAPYSPRGRTYHFESNPDVRLEDPFDLDNLRIFKPQMVRDFLDSLEKLTTTDKKIVAMIGRGGTLSMLKRGQELVPTLDPLHLLRYAGKDLDTRFSVASIQFPALIDSSQEEIDYAAESVIALSWIWKEASEALRHRLLGFFMPNGTDNLASVLIYMTFMLGPDCPFSVALAAAQKTTQDGFNEIPANVSNGIETLELLQGSPFRCCFFSMGGTGGGAFRPWSNKVSDGKVDAFRGSKILDASNFGVHGLNVEFEKQYADQSGSPKEWVPIVFRGYHTVYDALARLGKNPRSHYDHILSSRCEDTTLITTFGTFTNNVKVVRAIVEASRQRSPQQLVFGGNPFPDGSTQHAYQSANLMRDLGVVPVYSLPDATIAKIMLAKMIYSDRKAIAEFVATNNYVAEQPPHSIKDRLQQAQRNQIIKVLLGPTPELERRVWAEKCRKKELLR